MGVHFVIANFVTPKILGSRVDINAATSTIALLVWGELWGGLGLLLAIPLTSLIKILLENSGSEWLHWFASLMSARVVDKVLESTEATKKVAT
jgi:predicted PurR-regulated permease PerM